MPTQLAVEADSKNHWALLCLALYQEEHAAGATTRELYETADGVFDNAQRLSGAFHSLYNKRRLLEREDDLSHPRAYRYYLNESGWSMLKHIGSPTRTPGGDRVRSIDIPDKPPAVKAPSEYKQVEITDDADEAGQDPGPFESAKSRRRYFAQQDESEYLDWLENKWAPNHRLTDEQSGMTGEEVDEMIELNRRAEANGEVRFEGHDEMMEQVFGDDDDEEESVETIDLSPDWDWLGTQLVKLGFVGLARDAFEAKLSPRIVYNDVLDTIQEHAGDPDADLDLETGAGGATMVEAPADPEQVSRFKQALGIDNTDSDTATA